MYVSKLLGMKHVKNGDSGDVEEVTRKMIKESLRRMWSANGKLTLREIERRIAKAEKFIQTVEQEKSELVERNTKANYVPVSVSKKEVENSIFVTLDYATWLRAAIRGGSYHPEPIGLVFSMPAFDAAPVLFNVQGIGPWLHGNTVFLRPSRQTHAVSEFYREKMLDLGFEGFYFAEELKGEDFVLLVNTITNLNRLMSKTTRRKEMGTVVTFSGTEEAWRNIHPYVRHATVVVFNGPGNATAYVSPNADVDQAARRIALSSFENAGQYCFSLKVILVHEDVYFRFRDAYIGYASELKVGDPFEEETIIGPVRNGSVIRLWYRWVRQAEERILFRGQIRRQKHPLLGKVTYTSPVIFELDQPPTGEMFGSISALIRVSGRKQAVENIKNSPFGLYLAVFGDADDFRVMHALADQGYVGTVTHNYTINDVPEGRETLVGGWGGFRKSGKILDRRFAKEIVAWGGRYLPHDIALARPPLVEELPSGYWKKSEGAVRSPFPSSHRSISVLEPAPSGA